MLVKFILRAGVTAAALTCTTGSASADQYRITMVESAFFPEISYVQPGDVITFTNASGFSRTISAEDASWSISGLGDGAEASITVDAETPERFMTYIPAAAGEPADENGNMQIIGLLNFNGQVQSD